MDELQRSHNIMNVSLYVSSVPHNQGEETQENTNCTRTMRPRLKMRHIFLFIVSKFAHGVTLLVC